jgi:hypothetical protein
MTMAEALYLCTKSQLGGGETLINGCTAVIINEDDGETDAAILADAAEAASDAMGLDADSLLPATYFDTATKISDLSSGPLKDDHDSYVFLPGGPALNKVEGS